MMEKEKKTHGVQLLLRAIVRDPDGKIITDTGRKPTKSFVLQFLKFIGALMDGLSGTATDTGNTAKYIYYGSTPCAEFLIVNAGINVSLYGIQVGTGDTPEDNTDFVLATQLTEGVGAGNITHGAMVIGDATVVGANVDLELKRAFTNNTGSTITVKESGLVNQTDRNPYPEFLLIRDVLPASIDVPDKCSLTIIYTLRTTV